MKTLLTLITALLFTAGSAFAQTNDASIDQVGDDHEATITQAGSMNMAYVEQTADAGREGDDIGTATVAQEGSDNYVNLFQRNFFGDSEATITQLGDGNSVRGSSLGSAFKQNHGLNVIDVMMEGDDNTLYSLVGSAAQKNVNTLLLDILGSDNSVGLFQHFGYGDVDIEGDLNVVTLSQRGGSNANAQSAYVDILGSDNMVGITQTGDAHTANVDVTGSYNTSTITQSN
ncbi:curlin repeat-containing protein [Rhodohalobacter sp. 8-1]|uniref:curlin repeat-containing protein n=1 Tax=Rhodohalobacter sp. 8-1 TaxID=3131972 RepID=UPI0030EC68E3